MFEVSYFSRFPFLRRRSYLYLYLSPNCSFNGTDFPSLIKFNRSYKKPWESLSDFMTFVLPAWADKTSSTVSRYLLPKALIIFPCNYSLFYGYFSNTSYALVLHYWVFHPQQIVHRNQNAFEIIFRILINHQSRNPCTTIWHFFHRVDYSCPLSTFFFSA